MTLEKNITSKSFFVERHIAQWFHWSIVLQSSKRIHISSFVQTFLAALSMSSFLFCQKELGVPYILRQMAALASPEVTISNQPISTCKPSRPNQRRVSHKGIRSEFGMLQALYALFCYGCHHG